MPSTYRGVTFRNSGDPILHLADPPGIDAAAQRARLDVLRDLNQMHQQATGDAEIASRIASYEMAFRMQIAAPELLDFSRETAATRALYGLDDEKTRPFGTNCLLARRMVERGVRFVHLVHGSWDDHSRNQPLARRELRHDRSADRRPDRRSQTARACWTRRWSSGPANSAARRWAKSAAARRRARKAATIIPLPSRCGWPAAASSAATSTARTDEFGYNVVDSPVHVHDLQATILHLLGIDHERLTYRHAGRDFRLTDVAGKVVHGAHRMTQPSVRCNCRPTARSRAAVFWPRRPRPRWPADRAAVAAPGTRTQIQIHRHAHAPGGVSRRPQRHASKACSPGWTSTTSSGP